MASHSPLGGHSTSDPLDTGPRSVTARNPGSLVMTNAGNFYLAVSIGSLRVNDYEYVVLSPASPVGALMVGLKQGNDFVFNKKVFHIDHIY